MKLYKITTEEVEFDPTKTYLDFYIADGKQKLVEINLEQILSSLQSGKIQVDNKLQQYMTYLQRWTIEAPRKRGYRQLRKDGFTILSGEQFFDGEGGDEIINNLENTGKFADYFLQKIYTKNNTTNNLSPNNN